MSAEIEWHREGIEALPLLGPLWNELFDHHASIGAAGFPTIPREQSWPLRAALYRRIFADDPTASIWLATRSGAPVAYALAHEDALLGCRVRVLETLSVRASERGGGLGTQLMDAVDTEARDRGVQIGVVDVMGGNPRALALYRRRGFAPYSETWTRSRKPTSESPIRRTGLSGDAGDLGLSLEIVPGPDDTWVSSDEIVVLSAATPRRSAQSPAGGLPEYPAMAECRVDAVAALLDALERSASWTVQFELPPEPAAAEVRSLLRARGYAVTTERLLRAL